jgi:DNA polymerase-1
MPTQSKKHLVLVDGSSFLFRAYHAVPPLTNSEGEPTNAIYGVANMLRKLIAEHKTDYFTVVFDAPGKTFRHDMYDQYKAHRPPMPDDLRVQIEPLHNLIRAMGFPLIMEAGVEADDVLGALAQDAAKAGFNVVISTGDKDMAQLVTDKITLENTMSNTTMDIAGVMEKFGVKPEQIIDYLALMGDAVDNIPGVPKVGPKTAAKWLGLYETLDNLIENADKIKGKVGENLRNSLEQLPLSRELTTIKCDLALPYTMDDLKCQVQDKAELRHQLEHLGFSAWLRMLEVPAEEDTDKEEPATADIEKEYETILTQNHFDQWLQKLDQAGQFAFDTETTSLNYTDAEIVGVSFAIEAGKAAYVPLAHDYPEAPEQLNRDEILSRLKPLLENPDKYKIGQNLKYDANVLANYNIEMRGIKHDTMLESYVFNSTATKHNMDDLAKKYLGLETIHYEDVAGKGAKQILFSEIPLEQASPYAAEDADITLRLHQTLSEKLNNHKSLQKLYQDIEIPLIPVLSRIERNGVLIDSAMLSQQSLELANHIIALEQHAHDLAGQTFNLGSPKQIQEILYEQQKLPVLKKTPKGQPSTAESVLQELAN